LDIVRHFGDSSTGIGALGFSGSAFLIQLITFILAYFVLRRYAFGPILEAMRRRKETIDQGVQLGEQMKKEKAELEAKVDSELHAARVEADKILGEAHTSGRQAIQAAEEAARIKADGILASADDRIKQDTALASKRLKNELSGLVGEATEAIIHEKLDVKKDASLIDRALKRGEA